MHGAAMRMRTIRNADDWLLACSHVPAFAQIGSMDDCKQMQPIERSTADDISESPRQQGIYVCL